VRRHALLLVFLLVVGSPRHAWAHALGAECRLKDGHVRVEAFFDDDVPAASALVQVLNARKEILTSGKTDSAGVWTCTAPTAGQYAIVIDAGMGHRVTVSVTVPGQMPDARGTDVKTPAYGSERAEFTRFPLLKIGLGVGTLLLFSVAFVVARRRSRQ
jgi:hypothetical protein